MKTIIAALSLAAISTCVDAFVVTNSPVRTTLATGVMTSARVSTPLRMSDPAEEIPAAATIPEEEEEETPMDAAQREMMEKMQRSDELRAQETFMKRSTGRHLCGVCDYEFDEAKGDLGTIGGTVQPGTAFSDLPTNWRCPTCRASKDNFSEVVEEIPGFEVNQGYGFGTNSLTAGQKNLLIFGGLGFFFLLFLSGYVMS